MPKFQEKSASTSSVLPASEFIPQTAGESAKKRSIKMGGGLVKFVDDTVKKYEELKKEGEKTTKKYEELEKKVDELGKRHEELEEFRVDSLKSLGVFVALFTFVSVSFSILPKILHPLVLLGVVLVILGSLAFFVLLLAWIFDMQRIKLFTCKQIAMGISVFTLLGSGIALGWYGYDDMKSNDFYVKSEVDTLLNEQKEYSKDQMQEGKKYTKEEISDLKTCIAIRGIWPCVSK